MVESTLAEVRRLLKMALEECESDECSFHIRTALQLLEAIDVDLSEYQIDPSMIDDEDLRNRLTDSGFFETK